MHAKKFLALSLITCSLLLLAGCGKSLSSTDPLTGDPSTGATSDPIATTAQVTEAQCVDAMAYALKGAEYEAKWDSKNFSLWIKKLADMEKQYKVDNKTYQTVCNKMASNSVTFVTAVQKRLAELK